MARFFARREDSLPWWFYVALIVGLLALARYFQVESDVRNSPHHCSSVALAREELTLVGSPVLQGREVQIRGRRYMIREAWYERTFSYFRTGPFSHRKVINDDQLIFVAFGGLDLMKEQVFGSPLRFRLDGQYCDLMLSDDCGLLIHPRDLDRDTHELVIEDQKTIVERIEIPAGIERQPNQALQTTPMTRSVYEKTIEFGYPQRGV